MPGKGEKETEFNVTGRKGRDEEEEEEQEEEDTASDNRVTDIFKETEHSGFSWDIPTVLCPGPYVLLSSALMGPSKDSNAPIV
ncbi:uncharacterized [Tachysurus ichikawai]